MRGAGPRGGDAVGGRGESDDRRVIPESSEAMNEIDEAPEEDFESANDHEWYAHAD